VPPRATTFTVKGLDSIQRGFRALAQPELTRTAKPAFQSGSKSIFLPEVKKLAPRGPSPHLSAVRGTRGKKGPLSKNVTTKLLASKSAKRYNLLFAYTTGPRAWYRHFVIKGTRAHSLAKGARLRGNVNQNLPPFHPGSGGNDFVDRAGEAGQARFTQSFAQAVVNAWASRARRP